GGPDAVVMAGVSIELLQVYLLIHDDWMDADDVRRGGPSVPAMLRAHFGGRAAAPSPRRTPARSSPATSRRGCPSMPWPRPDLLPSVSPPPRPRWGACS